MIADLIVLPALIVCLHPVLAAAIGVAFLAGGVWMAVS